ncbi:MAG: T9SS type A sorting domain-containing protein [Ignavibacteria bacterium]
MNTSNQNFTYVVTIPGSYHYVCIPHAPGMSGDFNVSPIGITPIGTEVPGKFTLKQNYPNPFNPTIHFEFDIDEFGFVNLSVYDALGRKVETLVNQELKHGSYDVEWSSGSGATNYTSGVYFYKLNTGSFSDTKKMVLLK